MTDKNRKNYLAATIGMFLIDAAYEKHAADYVQDRVYDLLITAGHDDSLATAVSDAAFEIASLIAQPEDDYREYHDEAQQLALLDESIKTALDDANDRLETCASNNLDYTDEYFSIIIGHRLHRFIVGGPQTAALNKFINHISCENLYDL